MGLFGWDYPPGCNSVPGDEEYPCEVCGKHCDDCICDPCKVCGEVGDIKCLTDHGYVRNAAQSESRAKYEADCKAACEAEARDYAQIEEDALAKWDYETDPTEVKTGEKPLPSEG